MYEQGYRQGYDDCMKGIVEQVVGKNDTENLTKMEWEAMKIAWFAFCEDPIYYSACAKMVRRWLKDFREEK